MAELELSINGVRFSDSRIAYRYQVGVSVLSLHPRSGPVGGGTNVSVIGTALSRGSACRFGAQPAPRSEWVSAFELRCTAPPHMRGLYAVEISSNEEDWTSSHVEFAFVAQPQVLRVEPPMGPEHGGTSVRVSGENFERTRELSCRFGQT